MIGKRSHHNILLLVVICIILFLTCRYSYASDHWQSDTEKIILLQSQQSTIKSATNSELLTIVTTHKHNELDSLALNELIARGYQAAIPIFESRATTRINVINVEIMKAIVKLELGSDLKNKDDIYQLKTLINYFKKYSPVGYEYGSEHYGLWPFAIITTFRAVRYFGAYFLISNIYTKLISERRYTELIDVYKDYINDSDREIKRQADNMIGYANQQITILNNLKQRNEQIYSFLLQAKTTTLISIISTAKIQFQAEDYSLAVNALDATKILAERKVLSEIESTKLIKMFTDQIPKNKI